MKKRIKVLISIVLLMGIVGCSCTKNSAKDAIDNFFLQYKNLSSNVLEDLESVIKDEELTEEQKDMYRDVLKRQYQDLEYEIISEEYDDTECLVEVKIIVYDLYKVQNAANEYLINNEEEFLVNGTYSRDLFLDYKLEKMYRVTDRTEYTLNIQVTKNDNGNYEVTNISEEDLEKIHGIYNYEE